MLPIRRARCGIKDAARDDSPTGVRGISQDRAFSTSPANASIQMPFVRAQPRCAPLSGRIGFCPGQTSTRGAPLPLGPPVNNPRSRRPAPRIPGTGSVADGFDTRAFSRAGPSARANPPARRLSGLFDPDISDASSKASSRRKCPFLERNSNHHFVSFRFPFVFFVDIPIHPLPSRTETAQGRLPPDPGPPQLPPVTSRRSG
jgi:hypothetical protein